MSNIVYNAIITPDGTEICSRGHHDLVGHTDSKTGKCYYVDGGLSYLRRIGDFRDCQDVSLTDEDPFDQIRQKFAWGSYGKNGDKALHYIKLKDLEDAHIKAILLTQTHIFSYIRKLLEKELAFRKDVGEK